MSPGIWFRAYRSGHVAPGIWLRHTQEPVRVQRLVAHDVHGGDPKVPKPLCTQRLVIREGAAMYGLACHVL